MFETYPTVRAIVIGILVLMVIFTNIFTKSAPSKNVDGEQLDENFDVIKDDKQQ